MKTIFKSLLTDVDDAATEDIGQLREDEEGNVYIYLQGIANVAVGSWVLFLITSILGSTTALLAANAIGPVAIAKAAIVADKFGWFQVAGLNLEHKALTGAAAGARVVATATAGSVDDADVAGDTVLGAVFTVAETGGIAGAYLNYPYVTDLTGLAAA